MVINKPNPSWSAAAAMPVQLRTGDLCIFVRRTTHFISIGTIQSAHYLSDIFRAVVSAEVRCSFLEYGYVVNNPF